ncbi:acetylcholinesterase precursor [Xylariales sp. PMI_506]|nr:acetylcholinesterase precursor [Xylariales sp. PMI_506]
MSDDAAAEPRPAVQLPQGTVVGIRECNGYPRAVESFKGIPYALAPVGDLRFRPPVRATGENSASESVIDASQFGPRAPARQFVVAGPRLEESEDCLTANIFRQQPAAATAAVATVATDGDSPVLPLLPVAIYIHGGAFNRGNAAMHDTAAMVGWSEAPFIGVSFGYRIGALGFLPSKLSASEGALNLGLKDQICLMEWVQDNIHYFGGDKNNVTLMGLSAGAHSIGYHLLNYDEGEVPLFNRAIIESGAPTSRAVRYPDAPIHEMQFSDFLSEIGCPKDLAETEVFKFLRSLPLSKIADAQTTVFAKYNPSLRWAFQPVIDGEIIRRRPIDSWRAGQWHKVPILTGFTTNEGSLYVDKQMSTSEEFTNFWKTLLPQLSEEDVATIDALYPDPFKVKDSAYTETRRSVGQMYKRIEAAYAHYAYVAPVRQTAHFASSSVPVYVYHWALVSDPINGARHGDNMFYEMRDPARRGRSDTQEELSGVFHAYVTSFICTGSPDGVKSGTYAERPAWLAYEPTGGQVMAFGKDNKELVGGGGGPVGPAAELVDDSWAKEESDFWWSKVEISQQ